MYPTRESTMSKNSSETVGIANKLYMCKRKLKVRAFLASQSMKHIIKIFSGLDVKSRPVFFCGRKIFICIFTLISSEKNLFDKMDMSATRINNLLLWHSCIFYKQKITEKGM
jgi:hypothetical protein